jgi:GT2 family glycosyltransferase
MTSMNFRPKSNVVYGWLRKSYLAFPLKFETKRRIKNMIFRPAAFLMPNASFLKTWHTERRLEQRRKRFTGVNGSVYGGEDELKLIDTLLHWKDLLSMDKIQLSNQLIPLLQRKVRLSHLDKPGKPEVSIIIPCFGRTNYTLACMESLLCQETGCHFEILLADDCPNDLDLATCVARLKTSHLHYHCNSTNLGFTKNVNHAAERAIGSLILFLNNDTYCHPLWLERLVSTYRRLQRSGPIGAVGSKVLHSTLLVQESGCLMFPGAQPKPLGRGAHAFDPQFSFLREVDFVSACSLLIARQDFLDSGGFDERFSPGYFEDPDLCERLRRKGLASYVQPTSIVLHEEGASFGKNGYEKVAIEKARLFHQLHPSTTSSLPGYMARPRILFIDAYLPMPDKGSGGVDAMAFLEYFLAQGMQPIFYAHHHHNYFENCSQILESIGIEVLQNNFMGLEALIRDRGEEIQAVFISRFYQIDHFLPLLRRYLSHAKLIYNTVDLHFLREEREATFAANSSDAWLDELKAKELSYIRAVDASIVISKYEYSILKTLLPEVGHVHHIPQTRPFVGTLFDHDVRTGFVFIGSAHHPNVDALRYFQEAIHPLMIKSMPSYSLVVIGKELYESLGRPQDNELLDNPHIRFLGYIEDPTPIFDRAIAMFVPLRYGSGIKGKVVQSIQHAIPCITTSIGAEGLDLPASSSVIVADTPIEMVQRLHELSIYPDFWREVSGKAPTIFEERFSARIFNQRLDNLITQLNIAKNS